MAAITPNDAEQASSTADLPSRNPMPLSAAQEGQVRELYYKRVRNKCAEEVRAFAACCHNRTFSAPFVCRQQRLVMNACMVQYATVEEQDRAREQWFAERDKRKREREAKEEKRKQQWEKHKEWWGLDEQGRRIADGNDGREGESRS